ncbi:uncharacterized protein METZ01_LOCUS385011 [marine metagenome]|uniref:Uncharacterized protein n=1 Tax=marine metagenome TaxID=408172 RepID=A0A382UDP3_9ZZZZ
MDSLNDWSKEKNQSNFSNDAEVSHQHIDSIAFGQEGV